MPRRSALATGFPHVLCLFALATGCSDRSGPAAPSGAASGDSRFALMAPGSGGGPPASLRNIWPNEDGRSWTYHLDQRTWDSQGFRTYPTPEEVPPVPSMDEVAALLGNHPIGSNPVSEEAGYRMQFQGMRTTQSGAVGQNLETEVFELGQPSPTVVRGSIALGAGFWRGLTRARPDLAERIAAIHPEVARLAAAAGTASVNPPLYLFGYAWEKTREYIGSYGDLNTLLSWKYLEANLDPGHEFSMQLVPDLADDVFLHVRVLRERTATTPLGDHPRSIDVLYMVDYGVSQATDEDGNTIGYWQAYDYGTITYSPKVGPVASYERSLIQTGEPLDPGRRELSGDLTAVVPGKNGPLP
jgi:hypothetical protein